MLTVSKNSATTGGTTARLKTGDKIPIWDLLHGLMIPSGNDAAVCLAEYFGQHFYSISPQYKKKKGIGNKPPILKG